MEQMVSALLICIPTTLTVIIGIYQFYFLFSDRISKEKFFRNRKILGIIRMISNLIAIIVTLIFGLKYISIILTIITMNVMGIDVIFLIIENITSKKKR